jgi:D-amino peptidase
MSKYRILLLLVLVCFSLNAEPQEGLKVFISVDMEGLAGVVVSEECSRSGDDYGLFRKIMTLETNAAIEGAVAAGATEIIVRDSHGAKRNILPDLLDPRAKLLRGVSGATKNMMDRLDESFDAVMFIGYHAKAGTPDAIIEHTSTGNVTDFSINGVSLPEAGYNALIAGLYDVPVAFASGDEAFSRQVRDLLEDVETVAVKEGIGGAALCLHPEVARDRIRAGVEKALRSLDRFQPYKLSAPYTMVLKLKREEKVYTGALYPGAKRTGDWEVTYTSDNLLDVIEAFNSIK